MLRWYSMVDSRCSTSILLSLRTPRYLLSLTKPAIYTLSHYYTITRLKLWHITILLAWTFFRRHLHSRRESSSCIKFLSHLLKNLQDEWVVSSSSFIIVHIGTVNTIKWFLLYYGSVDIRSTSTKPNKLPQLFFYIKRNYVERKITKKESSWLYEYDKSCVRS